MPIFLILILNILLYIFYVWFISVAVSFLFPLVRKMLGMAVLNPYEHVELYNGIQYFIFIAVLVVTLLFFRHFYLTRNIQLQREEPKINGLKLLVTFANGFIVLVYVAFALLVAKYSLAIFLKDTIAQPAGNQLLVHYYTSILVVWVILLLSILLRKKAYFTFSDKYDYELYEAAMTEIDEEKVYEKNSDNDDELHIKIK